VRFPAVAETRPVVTVGVVREHDEVASQYVADHRLPCWSFKTSSGFEVRVRSAKMCAKEKRKAGGGGTNCGGHTIIDRSHLCRNAALSCKRLWALAMQPLVLKEEHFSYPTRPAQSVRCVLSLFIGVADLPKEPNHTGERHEIVGPHFARSRESAGSIAYQPSCEHLLEMRTCQSTTAMVQNVLKIRSRLRTTPILHGNVQQMLAECIQPFFPCLGMPSTAQGQSNQSRK
jgi:hypothetical protein